MKYDGKFASRWRAKSPDALCAVLPKEYDLRMEHDAESYYGKEPLRRNR